MTAGRATATRSIRSRSRCSGTRSIRSPTRWSRGLIRASYSTNIKDRRDASCGIYTADGDVIAMSEFGGTPLHLGTMHPAVQTVFTSWPAETLEPGDAIIMNTPYPAGPGHLNDVCVVGPVFVDGELFAIAASQSHRVDIGGFAPGLDALRRHRALPGRPPDHAHEDHAARRPGRAPARVHQPERAHAGRADGRPHGADRRQRDRPAADRGARDQARPRDAARLLRRAPGLLRAADDRRASGRCRRARTTARTSSRATGSSRTTLRSGWTSRSATAASSPTSRRSDPQVLGPINCRWPSVAACVYYLLKCLVDPELPANAGAYRPVEVRTRPGTLLEAQFPAAVCNANIITTQRIVDAMLRALIAGGARSARSPPAPGR